jgi:hypothetical protein
MKSFHRSLAVAVMAMLLAPALARAQEEDDSAPLDGVIADMQVAGGRLAKLLTDKPTQQKQKDAIDKLDGLIKLLEERRRQNGGMAGMPERPAEESTIRQGPGGSGPLHDANRNGRGWGQLPAHKRQQILQSMTEGFPPHYQQLLERYYRRLAEEKPAGEVLDEAGAAPAAPKGGDTEKSSGAAIKKPAPAVANSTPADEQPARE